MKIVLIGDSIREGYEPLVTEMLSEQETWSPEENCRHSQYCLDWFYRWVVEEKADIVHVNFGIHDSSIYEVYDDGEHYILLDQYKLNLRRFIHRMKNEAPGVKMIWATTTPRYLPEIELCHKPEYYTAEWAHASLATVEDNPKGAKYHLADKYEIDKYNSVALEIVNEAGITVNDLHAVVMKNDFRKCLRSDGCHMSEFGNKVLAEAVTETIRREL